MRLGVIKMAIRKLGGDDFRGLGVDMGGLFGVDENMVVRLRKLEQPKCSTRLRSPSPQSRVFTFEPKVSKFMQHTNQTKLDFLSLNFCNILTINFSSFSLPILLNLFNSFSLISLPFSGQRVKLMSQKCDMLVLITVQIMVKVESFYFYKI